MIKLKCVNNKCAFSYEITSKELEDNPQYHKVCLVCGSQMKVDNLDEIIELDLYKRAEEYIKLWIKELGLEGCIELIERNQDQSCYRIYKEKDNLPYYWIKE
jgi:hypothetical protein